MENHPVTPATYAADEISLIEIWRFLVDHWITIAAGAVLGFVCGGVVAALTPEVYRAQALVVEVQGGEDVGVGGLGLQLGGLAGLAGIDLSTMRGQSRSAQMIVRSRTFGERFVVAHNLWPFLYPTAWDSEKNDWLPEVENPPTLAQAGTSFQGIFRLEPSETVPGATAIVVEWEDPEIAARWANQIVVLANEIARRRDIENANRTVAFLTKSMQETNVVELQRALYNLLETEQKTLMLANARDEYAFELIDSAVVEPDPVKPNVRLVVVIGTVLGMIIVVASLLLLRLWQMLQVEAAQLRGRPTP